jgi:hypothetical protein
MAISRNNVTFSSIRDELNLTGQNNLSINQSDLGNYAPINQLSAEKPNQIPQSSFSEWLGYDHKSATGCTETTDHRVILTDKQMAVFTIGTRSGTVNLNFIVNQPGRGIKPFVLYPINAQWSTATDIMNGYKNSDFTVSYPFSYNAANTDADKIAVGFIGIDPFAFPQLPVVSFVVSVECLAAIPAVVTTIPYNLGNLQFTSGGNVLSSGRTISPVIVTRGLFYDDVTPPFRDFISDPSPALGSYTSFVNNLADDTTYYVQAMAENTLGLRGYGNIESIYVTKNLTVSCQVTWQTKNLAVTTYLNGEAIPLVTDPTQWANLTTGAYCYVNGSNANTAAYGLLYNAYALMDPRGFGLPGWVIPNYYSFKDMDGCYSGVGSAVAIKQAGTTRWASPNTGTNTSGITLLPTPIRNSDGTYSPFNGTLGDIWIYDETNLVLNYLRIANTTTGNITTSSILYPLSTLKEGRAVRLVRQ